MTVYDNLAFSLQVQKESPSKIRQKVQEVAAMLDLSDYLNRKPKQLSGGQKQRVALGSAIIRNPDILLMDEPLSNLDAKLRVQIRKDLIQLHKKLGKTTVYVTHDQTEAMTMASRIVILNKGVIQQAGTPEKVYNEPANIFVATFIGMPSMNIFYKLFAQLDPDFLEDLKKLLASHNRRLHDTVVGIRAEDIKIVQSNQSKNDIKVKVDTVEMLGDEMLIYTAIGSETCVIKTETIAVKPGDSINITFDQNKLHLFDAETEQRIN